MRIITARQTTDVKLLADNSATVTGMLRGGGDARRAMHWDLEDAARNISWIRGSITTVANNLIAPSYTFVKVKGYEKEATPDALDALKEFYGFSQNKDYSNFKHFYTTSGKFYATAMAIALGNFSAWEVVKDSLFGYPMGFEFIPGYIEPNIESSGKFKDPAFVQYLSSSGYSRIEWKDPKQIVFFARPDFGGYAFSSDLESLVQYTLPSEIYAALSWLSMHKNRTAPLDGYWVADSNMDTDAFKKLEQLLNSRYRGAKAYSKSPILAKGEVEFKAMRRTEDEMPYQEGRAHARKEIAGVTHVPEGKSASTPDSREAKRDYYETVIEPLQQLIEETTYEQVHVRLMGIRGWSLKFNNPAFVNELEQASIDRTYWNIGKVNANELRARDGQEARPDGDKFFEPTNMVPTGGKQDEERPVGENPGAPVLDPSEEDPVGQKPRPVRADEQSIREELHKWKRVAIKQAKGERKPKPFQCKVIPDELKDCVIRALEVSQNDIETINYAFELALRRLN